MAVRPVVRSCLAHLRHSPSIHSFACLQPEVVGSWAVLCRLKRPSPRLVRSAWPSAGCSSSVVLATYLAALRMAKVHALALALRSTFHSDRNLAAALCHVLPSSPFRLVGLLVRGHSNQAVGALACLVVRHDQVRILLWAHRNLLVVRILHDLGLVRTLVVVLQSGLNSWSHRNSAFP